MKKLIILIILIISVNAQARDGDFGNRAKHFGVGFVIGALISGYCNEHLKDEWGCFLAGTIPTTLGAALFEAIQDDRYDAGGDLLAGGLGAATGAACQIKIKIPFPFFDGR